MLRYFAYQWWASRDAPSLLRDAGAMVVAAILLALATKNAVTNQKLIATKYKTPFEIAWLYRRMGQTENAIAAGKEAEAVYAESLRADPDAIEAQLWHAQSLAVLAKISDAVEEIVQLLRRTGEQQYRIAASDLLVLAAGIVMTRQTPNRELAADLLRQAIQANSENLVAHVKLVGLTKLDDQTAGKANKFVGGLSRIGGGGYQRYSMPALTP